MALPRTLCHTKTKRLCDEKRGEWPSSSRNNRPPPQSTLTHTACCTCDETQAANIRQHNTAHQQRLKRKRKTAHIPQQQRPYTHDQKHTHTCTCMHDTHRLHTRNWAPPACCKLQHHTHAPRHQRRGCAQANTGTHDITRGALGVGRGSRALRSGRGAVGRSRPVGGIECVR